MNDGQSVPIITVFRSRLRSDATDNGYDELAAAVEVIARSRPGFVDFKTFAAADGERVALVVFDSIDNHDAWRDDPVHRAAQGRGTAEFYESYSISVSQQLRSRTFPAGPDRSAT